MCMVYNTLYCRLCVKKYSASKQQNFDTMSQFVSSNKKQQLTIQTELDWFISVYYKKTLINRFRFLNVVCRFDFLDLICIQNTINLAIEIKAIDDLYLYPS